VGAFFGITGKTMKILAFSDIHGEIGAVKALVKAVRGKTYDAIIFCGDFASFSDAQAVYEEIMEQIQKIGAPCYYVFGNRDRSFDPFGIGLCIDPEATFPTHLSDQKVEIGEGISITSNPSLIDEKTIFISHLTGTHQKDALLHIEGHVHYGIVYKNYINTGFLFRDDFHDEPPGLGCYWEINIENGKIEIEWVNLGIMKPIDCKVHKDFIFFVPDEWNICPFCRGDYNENWLRFFGRGAKI
jgi:predicted phosphodiesterase